MPTPFEPIDVGGYRHGNRLFMAPLTRGRATREGVATELMATYYRQRATAGLIISEATSISPQGVGWAYAPGIWTDAQVEGWRPVTQAVHAAGGRIWLQLWHMGRQSHPSFQRNGELPVAPSAIAPPGDSRTYAGKQPYVTPRALTADELPGVAADYARAARNAMAAGFDGVEVHGANGYLLDEFIRSGSNQRTDEFGGSVANRWRFPLQVVDAVAAAIGAERTGLRLSPTNRFGGMSDEDPVSTFAYGAGELEGRGLAFLHVIDSKRGWMFDPQAPAVAPTIRARYSGTLVLNGGYTLEDAQAAIAGGACDAVAMGVPFLANPDLVARLQAGAPLNAPHVDTFYTQGAEGYTDYPTMG